jgi:peptide/nickel transport system substrate-binding protein
LKKTLLILSAVALALTVLPFTPSQTPIAAQDDTSIIRIGTLDLPTTLDPATADTFAEWEIFSHLYTGLTQRVPGSTEVELAAASDHAVSEDGLTHTFTLRDDLAFNDGTPLTAINFRDSIERVQLLNEGGADIMNGVVEDVEAPDATTLVFTLTAPVPYFLELVSKAPFYAVHPDDFAAGEVRRSTEPLVGNGVYIMGGYELNAFLELRPNPDYTSGEPAQNNGVRLQHYTATEDLRLAIVAGDVDVAWREVRVVDAVATAEGNAPINILQRPSTRMWYWVINLGEQFAEFNSDIVLREVIARTIDRDNLVTGYFDNNVYRVDSYVPELVGDAFNPVYTPFEDRDSRGVELLVENGYSPNRPVPMSFASSRSAYGDYYADVLTRLRTTLTPINRYVQTNSGVGTNPRAWLESLEDGAFQSALFAFTPVAMHPEAYLRPMLHSQSMLPSATNYALTEVDVLLNQARRTQDTEAANELYREAQALMLETYALFPMWQGSVHILYRDTVSGVTIEPDYYLHYDLLELN